jgi:hypothetical protein
MLRPPPSAELGDVWRIETDAFLPLLRQFHAGATGTLHHLNVCAEGAYATLAARNGSTALVVTRVHAEFELAP